MRLGVAVPIIVLLSLLLLIAIPLTIISGTVAVAKQRESELSQASLDAVFDGNTVAEAELAERLQLLTEEKEGMYFHGWYDGVEPSGEDQAIHGLYVKWGAALTHEEYVACGAESCSQLYIKTGQFRECPAGVVVTGNLLRDGSIVGTYEGRSGPLEQSSPTVPVLLKSSMIGQVFDSPRATCE